jgi:hypothetical protein
MNDTNAHKHDTASPTTNNMIVSPHIMVRLTIDTKKRHFREIIPHRVNSDLKILQHTF